MRWFILIGIGFLLGAIIASGGVWYAVQNILQSSDDATKEAIEAESTASEYNATNTPETLHGSIAEESDPVDTPVANTVLTEKQRALIESFGVDVESFVLTPEMQRCATEALGESRMAEIVAGATPSLMEAAKLAGCL